MTVDVDCSVTGFADGERQERHTVSYQHLNNREGRHAKPATIVHTGDILVGQRGAGELADLERIYVDLAQLPAELDALALEANVFTADRAFSDLERAFVRLVNADTNQELCRLELASGAGGPIGSDERVALFARMLRVTPAPKRPTKDVPAGGEWRLVGACEPRAELYRKLANNQDDMRVASTTAVALAEPNVTTLGANAVGADAGGGGKNPQRSGGAIYAAPAIALATAAGVTAAVAVFVKCDSLDIGSFAPNRFESGVDWSDLAEPFTKGFGAVDCGGCGDACPCIEQGCGAVVELCPCGAVGDLVGNTAQAIGGCFDGCFFAIGFDPVSTCGGCGGAISDVFGLCGDVLGQNCGCISAVGDCGGLAGGCVEGCGELASNGCVCLAEGCGGAFEILGGCLGGAFEILGGCLGAVLGPILG